MIQICRAEDGHIIELNESLWDLERLENLEAYLQEKTGVPQEAILAYLSDGRRLTKDNVRDLAGVQDQSIYTFNKRYLDIDLEQALHELRVDAPLQPPVEDTIASTPPFRISQLASSYANVSRSHNDSIKQTLATLRYQQAALRIASSTLDLHVLAIADVFDSLSTSAQRELDKQTKLLTGLDGDLEVIRKVKVHREFVSATVRKAMDAGEKGRTLGDYVSNDKMRQVAASCAKTHQELQERFRQAREAMLRLSQGSDEVRIAASDQIPIEDAESCARRSMEDFERIMDLTAQVEKAGSSPGRFLQDFRQADSALRSELQFMIQLKNSYTEQCIVALRRISTLNNDLVDLPPALSSLQAGFKGKTSFSHIQRLHNMLYAYGATVVEIVRRKEFARFFYQRSQSILEIMAKLTANERKRRHLYRGEVQGQLPFDVRGMDDAVPSIDFSPTGSLDFTYSLERADIDMLLQILNDLDDFANSSEDPAALSSVKEARAGLDRLIGKMDSLESGFDRIAERSLLSSSRLLSHRRRSPEDDQAYAELEIQIQELQQLRAEQESSFQHDRSVLEAEIAQLRDALQTSEAARGPLERDLHSARAQLESEATSRRIMEERNAQLCADADGNRQSLAGALAEATEQTKAAEILRQELARARAQFEDVKALEARNAQKVASLLEEQANTLARLEEARARGEDLEMQIQDARTESDDVKRALIESGREKDRLLRAQASEHDRLMRDHIAEADGDRAVLEHQFSELKAELEDCDRQLKDTHAQAEMAVADAVGLREELQRVEHELREARHIERLLRDDLRTGRTSQSDFEQRLEDSSRLVAQILDVALAFRDSHVKALVAAQTMASHPAASKSANHASLVEPSFGGGRHSLLGNLGEPEPIDPSDPASALEALRAFDHDHFLEAIGRAGSTMRKWQKQCKEYRERAKGKISFRNFAKGDLALFLPTRNSVSKPWAAFNVSFPHYFLQATGHLAEQLKTREWIVARITSITERVVDVRDPSTNPYGLGDGVKYYMLEVEDWTQPAYPSKRRESSRKASAETHEPATQLIPEASTLPPGPPEPEVEESFSATLPPTSRLFPRTRSNSSQTAGPSSLSRLLAQAGPADAAAPPVDMQKTSPQLSPTISSQPPPATHAGSLSHSQSTQLRPGSRASRVSMSSQFSVGRVPFGNAPGAAKAAATTAISEQEISTLMSRSDAFGGASGSSTPSPEDSPTLGMSSLLAHRRRTSSYHVGASTPFGAGLGAGGASASSRLASLASTLGMSFGRRRRPELAGEVVESPTSASKPSSPSPLGAGQDTVVEAPSPSA